MEIKDLQEDDLNLVRNLWGKRLEFVSLGFNLRQQYLDSESQLLAKVHQLDTELNTLIKMLKEKAELGDDWKLDLQKGAFVSSAPAVEASS